MDWITERRFLQAAKWGRVEEVKEILRDHPNIDVNWKDEKAYATAALLLACQNGHDAVVTMLLAHPDIDVNQMNDDGWTPFLIASFNGHSSCAGLLLKDPRVITRNPNQSGSTPLRRAVINGCLGVVKVWIASGREMDLGELGDGRTDALQVAKERGMATLLERFKEDPEETRHQVRVNLGWYDEAAAEMFALVVFVSDGLLDIKTQAVAIASPAASVFTIARQLPMELQQVLCFRMVGSAKEIILGVNTTLAFKDLARRY